MADCIVVFVYFCPGCMNVHHLIEILVQLSVLEEKELESSFTDMREERVLFFRFTCREFFPPFSIFRWEFRRSDMVN